MLSTPPPRAHPPVQKCRDAGQAPVHAAAREGSLEVLQYLYGAGFGMADLDAERKSPLHHAPIGAGQPGLAARRGAAHRQVAEVLLASGCRVDAADAHGCTPLHFAAGGWALPGGGVAMRAHRPCMLAIRLHTRRLDPAPLSLTALCVLPPHPTVPPPPGAGATDMLARFIELAAPGVVDAPDSIGWSPLFWACNNGHGEAGPPLAASDALWLQVIARVLLAQPAAAYPTNPRLLRRTRPAGAGAAAERLLQEGASPWAKDCNQRLPLHFASEAGHTACVRLLVNQMRRGGEPGTQPPSLALPDQNGQTPVQLAAEHGHPDCAALLLDADGTGEGGVWYAGAPLSTVEWQASGRRSTPICIRPPSLRPRPHSRGQAAWRAAPGGAAGTAGACAPGQWEERHCRRRRQCRRSMRHCHLLSAASVW